MKLNSYPKSLHIDMSEHQKLSKQGFELEDLIFISRARQLTFSNEVLKLMDSNTIMEIAVSIDCPILYNFLSTKEPTVLANGYINRVSEICGLKKTRCTSVA